MKRSDLEQLEHLLYTFMFSMTEDAKKVPLHVKEVIKAVKIKIGHLESLYG